MNYVVCRFVPDPLRDEALNVGVIVVSDDESSSASSFNLRFKSRLDSLGSTADYRAVKRVIESLRARTGIRQAALGINPGDMITNTDQLRFLSHQMNNQIQMTEPRPFRAESLEHAASELYGIFVSPHRKPSPLAPAPAGMSIDQLRRVIRETIRHWGSSNVSIQEKALEKVNDTRHIADFWLESGSPIAAFVAIPEDPGDRYEAWARRDSIPTIADAFRASDPRFTAVAVLPPNGHEPSSFVKETQAFLQRRTGVLVIHADQLEDHRREILHEAL